MTDRELLELAAKAAGIEIKGFDRDTPVIDFDTASVLPWNPLTDDGDALRLAVKLELTVLGPAVRDGEGRLSWVSEETEPDLYAATRRAIVRAAAAIGVHPA